MSGEWSLDRSPHPTMESERKIAPVVRKFSSFAEAEEYENEYYASLTPQERLDILLQLNSMLWDPNADDATTGLKSVYRIVKFKPRKIPGGGRVRSRVPRSSANNR